MKADIKNFIQKMPKTELHVHLEGAIPLETLHQIIQKYDINISLETLKQKFQYKDFSHFLEMWVWKNSLLREYEDNGPKLIEKLKKSAKLIAWYLELSLLLKYIKT